ncbi:uncharacterized protein LOC126264336 [Aethina tumida]|uniref:uncharacterized protein LOC126264336 n=1 Tax=Aethina tumida TaxID=116153 RepID=UPI0021477FB0|nr:uncharacterized protein LOC126264336 [Aethina tumida]
MLQYIIYSVFICAIHGKSVYRDNTNNTAVLISRYAKVSHYGQNDTQNIQQGRSNSGQSLWTHRSDATVASGQNLKKIPQQRISYHYASAKTDEGNKKEVIPGIGEVIQDRFNPKPYFFGNGNGDSAPNPVYSPPAKQVDAKPSTADSSPPKPPANLYTSPYSSYNPPNVLNPVDYQDNGPVYPPNTPPTPKPTQDSYAGPPPDSLVGGIYDKKPDTTISEPPKPTHTAPLLPLAPPSEESMPDHPMPPESPMPDSHHSHSYDGPPNYPPKSEDDIYYPPDNPHETIVDHPPNGPPPMGSAPPPPPPPSIDSKPDMAEDDLSPPPADSPDLRFPSYLYDHGHGHDQPPYDFYHDHHVYEEVEHPTTPAPQEDKRVSSSHYSYYYLGRKLWYIPLYFSIYFVLYVTVLILKSIARHKIEFRHHFDNDDKRKARNLDLDTVHKNVTSSINAARLKYM